MSAQIPAGKDEEEKDDKKKGHENDGCEDQLE